MNNVTYVGDFNDPIFLDAAVGKTNFTKVREWSSVHTPCSC
jgi:hypothetical protein